MAQIAPIVHNGGGQLSVAVESEYMPMRSIRAFSLIELLVVVAVIALLIAIMVPVLSKAVESSRRATCATNLNALGKAMRIYLADTRSFPRTNYNPTPTGTYNKANYIAVVAFSAARGYDPFNTSTTTAAQNCSGDGYGGAGSHGEYSRPYDNDVTAALFLLVRQGRMNSKQFVCPSAAGYFPDVGEFPATRFTDAGASAPKRVHGAYSDNGKQDTNMAWRSNFTKKKNLSYSVALPYSTSSWKGHYTQNQNLVLDGMGVNYVYNAKMAPGMALAADLNPGDTPSLTPVLSSLIRNSSSLDMLNGNSSNHARVGQNVLYVAGNVDWTKTPFVGVAGDNIYTRAKPIPDSTSSTPSPDGASDYTDPISGSQDTYGGEPPSNANDSILLPTETSQAQTGTLQIMPY